jgi:hypothetical protein
MSTIHSPPPPPPPALGGGAGQAAQDADQGAGQGLLGALGRWVHDTVGGGGGGQARDYAVVTYGAAAAADNTRNAKQRELARAGKCTDIDSDSSASSASSSLLGSEPGARDGTYVVEMSPDASPQPYSHGQSSFRPIDNRGSSSSGSGSDTDDDGDYDSDVDSVLELWACRSGPSMVPVRVRADAVATFADGFRHHADWSSDAIVDALAAATPMAQPVDVAVRFDGSIERYYTEPASRTTHVFTGTRQHGAMAPRFRSALAAAGIRPTDMVLVHDVELRVDENQLETHIACFVTATAAATHMPATDNGAAHRPATATDDAVVSAPPPPTPQCRSHAVLMARRYRARSPGGRVARDADTDALQQPRNVTARYAALRRRSRRWRERCGVSVWRHGGSLARGVWGNPFVAPIVYRDMLRCADDAAWSLLLTACGGGNDALDGAPCSWTPVHGAFHLVAAVMAPLASTAAELTAAEHRELVHSLAHECTRTQWRMRPWMVAYVRAKLIDIVVPACSCYAVADLACHFEPADGQLDSLIAPYAATPETRDTLTAHVRYMCSFYMTPVRAFTTPPPTPPPTTAGPTTPTLPPPLSAAAPTLTSIDNDATPASIDNDA